MAHQEKRCPEYASSGRALLYASVHKRQDFQCPGTRPQGRKHAITDEVLHLCAWRLQILAPSLSSSLRATLRRKPSMNITRPAQEARKRAKHGQRKSRLDLYPMLGIVLVILLALLTYGGLFLFLR